MHVKYMFSYCIYITIVLIIYYHICVHVLCVTEKTHLSQHDLPVMSGADKADKVSPQVAAVLLTEDKRVNVSI